MILLYAILAALIMIGGVGIGLMIGYWDTKEGK